MFDDLRNNKKDEELDAFERMHESLRSRNDQNTPHSPNTSGNANSTPDWLIGFESEEDEDKNKPFDPKETQPNFLARQVKLFDPNETQKTKAVKREVPATLQKAPVKPRPSFINLDKHDKAFLGLCVIGLYLIVFNLIGWAIPTGIDNLIIDVIGLYLYNVLADRGYDVRNLLPRKQK